MTNFRLLKSILFFTLLALLMISCGGTTPQTPTQAPVQSNFSYFVRVQADKEEDIIGAQVTIEVIDKAPLDEVTDSKGIARIIIDTTYAGKPGRLIAVANGYERYTQNIDVVQGVLPDVIKLKSLKFDEPTFTPSLPTATDVSIPVTNTPPAMPIPPTSILTDTSIPVTDTPTSTPVPAFTSTPVLSPTQTSTNTPSTKIDGKIALPLNAKVYVADINGNELGYLDMACQPAYSNDGAKLIVNGDNGPLDKLRLSGPTGENAREIGDPGLGGHSHPVWSPDGEQVMYDDHTIGGEIWRIFRRYLDDTNTGPGEEIMAAAGPIVGQNPMWTTGERFVFRGCKTWTGDAGQCGLWVMQGNRGNPIRLSNNLNQIPTDIYGDTLVYVSNDGGDDWNIYTMNISNGETQQLTSNPAADGLATISPDGQSVAFLSNRDGLLAVWYVGIKGGSPKKMFDIPPDWGTLRANGWSEEKLSWGK